GVSVCPTERDLTENEQSNVPDRPARGIPLPPRRPDHLHRSGSMPMAAMKPRTGDGPLEVTKEGRGIIMRVPLEGGGRLVVEMNPSEADDLSAALKSLEA